jgi:hypothetical protein
MAAVALLATAALVLTLSASPLLDRKDLPAYRDLAFAARARIRCDRITHRPASRPRSARRDRYPAYIARGHPPAARARRHVDRACPTGGRETLGRGRYAVRTITARLPGLSHGEGLAADRHGPLARAGSRVPPHGISDDPIPAPG